MSDPVKRRLLHAVGATSLGPILTALIQLVSVPVFLHYWGAQLYGEWLVLSAVPVYIGFTDFGIGNVAGNEMTMRVAMGERDSALSVFQSAWLLTTCASVFITVIVALTIWILPIDRWLKVSLISRGHVTAILCILCVYILLDMQWTIMAAGYRCDGNYALGQLVGNTVRFTTNTAAIVAVALHASPVAVAAALVISRFIGNRVIHTVLLRKSPWLHYGYSHAHWAVIRTLFRPGIAYLAVPAGSIFINQGMTVVVGLVLGPIAVVIFSTIRTLSRFAYQMANLIGNSIWAEMSAAIGAGNQVLARNLHRVAFQATMASSSAAVLFLLIFGRTIYGAWTHHNMEFDRNLFDVLLVEVLASAAWYTSSIVPLSCNRHERQSLVILLTSAASLAISYLLMLWIGLLGAGIGLLIGDACMIAYVFTASMAMLNDSPLAFFRAILSRPSLTHEHLEPIER